jgi:hypothetical protein
VLSVDEKSPIQALDRTQLGLPMKEGQPATMTHDYGRHGTTTLFAALNVLGGTVLGRCMQRHRHQEFLRFLNAVEAAVPAGKLVHAIMDNYAAHKHPKVRAWLERHPRWTFHFTPTSCSWLNAVEGFPCPSLTAQGEGNLALDIGEALATPGGTMGDAGQPLGEGPSGAARLSTEEPSSPDPDGHRTALPGQVGEAALVATMHARGRYVAVRASRGLQTDAGDDGDAVRFGQDLLDREPARNQRENAFSHSGIEAVWMFPLCAYQPAHRPSASRNLRDNPYPPPM